MIIKTSCGRFYSVQPAQDPDLDHVYIGFQVKHVAGRWAPGGNIGPQWVALKSSRVGLIRKAATQVVEA